MPLNKLSNFIRNVEGKILYVNPNDIDATDAITNDGASLTTPFKTIQRALLEAARFSYVKGDSNDLVEKTTILLFPGEHIIDNRPGWPIYNDNGAKVKNRSGTAFDANVLSLGLDSVFDLTEENNILYKFNSFYGGVVVPRGTSIVGLDLRKTKIRPKYVPNPTDSTVPNSAIFRITGACYFWQFSIFDGDLTSVVYTDPTYFDSNNRSTPNFSHHKLTCFEFCDGVNDVDSYDLTDLEMYYSKVSNAYNAYRNIDEKYPANPLGFTARTPEWEIVGAFATDKIKINNIISGDGSTATEIITVTTDEPHYLNQGTPIKITGVSDDGIINDDPYNISTRVQNVTSSTQFTYLLPNINAYPSIDPTPNTASAYVTVETDTVSGASPYIFNCSLRSVWGMNGLHADGRKASGFRSTVVAQFTAVSLQKDDRAFVKYDKESRTYQGASITTQTGAVLSEKSSYTIPYHLDPDSIYRSGWESSHIKISNDAFIQIVSVFAIGFNKHFDANTGGDGSITNSNSNFGQISLNSSGFKKEAFDKDDKAYITSIVSPRAITQTEENIEWLSLDVQKTVDVGISSHLYLYGFTSPDSPPSSIIQGYRIGARLSDSLYVPLGVGTSEASIYMCDNAISSSGITTAIGTTSSVKFYDATVSAGYTTSFTIGSNKLITGEKVKILSDDGDLPENIAEHETYYVINSGDNNTIKLASSYNDSLQSQPITVSGGTNLHILSRVSDKESGDVGSPVQYDAQNSNWFIHVNAGNQIYNALSSGGVATYGETTDLTYVKRIPDNRNLVEKIYKFRVVIPKEIENGKDPEPGFILQESSTTGVRFNDDFTITSIASTDYNYNRNPRFISTCSESSGTVTVIAEKPHNLQTGDIVVIKNVTSTTNTTAKNDVGFNGRFNVTGITNAYTFQYSTQDVNGITHSTGTFTNNTASRTKDLPRFERNDLKGNLYVYRNEIISPYIHNQQDGIYHLYVLNSNNKVTTEFTNLEFSQLPKDLYPQLDRDNVNDSPSSSKTFAKRSPLGSIVTNDLKKSITRETVDLAMKKIGIGLTISSVSSSTNSATITFPRFHGLSGITSGYLSNGGASYTQGTYYNVKLLNTNQSGTWNGATAYVNVTSGGDINTAKIIEPGSGYSSSGFNLYFDQSVIGGGNNATFTVPVSGISSNIGDVIQFTGAGTTADGYYRITSVPSSTTVSIAKTSGDPTILSSQYAFIVGSSVQITSTTYNSTSGITVFTTTTSHGLVVGNKFKVIDSSNNNLGDYIVSQVTDYNVFKSVTNRSLSASSGYILKHGISANGETSGNGEENFGTRSITFYDNDNLTLTAELTTGSSISISSSGVGTDRRLPLGSYIQIDNEIMRVISSNNLTTANVIRGALGTIQETHRANSLIRRIKLIPVEFRRPSILRASGHTFEYLGYGPGNYSTSLPQVQVKTLTDQENFLAQSQERSGGVVVYTGMNNTGDFFNGNTKTSAASGEVISYDIPKPTVTGEDPNKLSVVFDEVTVQDRLLVQGGKSNSVLSQFNGPVTFNKNVKLKEKTTFSKGIRITEGTQSTSTTTGDLVVSGGVGIGKNVNVGGSLDVGNVNAGITSVTELTVSGLTSTSTLNVSGISTFVGFSTFKNGISVSGVSTFNSNIVVGTGASFIGNGTIPVGGIIMWSGSTVPVGWATCNGSNGTPDLRDKFIIGVGTYHTLNSLSGVTTTTLSQITYVSNLIEEKFLYYVSANNDVGTWQIYDETDGEYVLTLNPGSGTYSNYVSANVGINTSHSYSIRKGTSGITTTANYRILNGEVQYDDGTVGAGEPDWNDFKIKPKFGEFYSNPSDSNNFYYRLNIPNSGISTVATGNASYTNEPPYYALAYIMRIA